MPALQLAPDPKTRTFFAVNREKWRLAMPKTSQRRKDECRAALLEILKPGDTVVCVLRSAARSGMSRRIDIYKVEGGDMRYLSNLAADLLEYRNDGGVVMTGCGMDMGFALVYELGAHLWPNGTPEPHGRRNGEPDSAGGYALKHRWL